jgi:hypothetical protein
MALRGSNDINSRHVRLQQQKQHQPHCHLWHVPWQTSRFVHGKVQYAILTLLMISIIQWEYRSSSNRQLMHLISSSSSGSSTNSLSSLSREEPITRHKEEGEEAQVAVLPSECFLSEEEMKNITSSLNNNHQEISWQGAAGLNEMVGFGFGGMLLCHQLSSWWSNTTNNSNRTSSISTSATLRMEFDCQKDAFERVFGATGNQLLQFYGTRLAARAYGQVDVHVHCPDAMQHRASLILPWITGYFPATKPRITRFTHTDNNSNNNDDTFASTCPAAALSAIPNVTQACQAFLDIPISHAIPDIRFDLRRMALSIAGGLASFTDNNNNNSSISSPIIYEAAQKFKERYLVGSTHPEPPPHQGRMDIPFVIPPPLTTASAGSINDDPWSNGGSAIRSTSSNTATIELDDAVIHFRCGDLMSLGHPDYCFVPFASFSNHISPHVRSIGIVTQPFVKTDQSRAVDVKTIGLHRCRVVVQEYQAFLQRQFPNAQVTIHNDAPTETMTMAYTRMILANQTFCMASTFPIFAALATFGQAYIHVPRYEKAPSRFLLSPPPNQVLIHENNNNNIHLLRDEPYILAGDLIKLWKRDGGEDAVLNWFRQDPNNKTSSTTTTTTMNVGNIRARVSS